MNLTQVYILIIAFTLSIPKAFAQERHSKKEVAAMLMQLDSAITNKEEYQQKRKLKADELEAKLSKCSPDTYIACCKQLYYSVVDYDGTRAIEYLQLIEKSAEYTTDASLRHWVLLSQADIYCTMGFYHKAVLLLNSIDKSSLTDEERLNYYHTSRSIYGNITEFLSGARNTTNEEVLLQSYIDSILTIEPEGIGRDLALADKYIFQNQQNKAIELIGKRVNSSLGKEYIYCCAALALAYEQKGETNEAIYYLAITSLNDIKNGTREYQAMPHLIQALYKTGDINRAYHYLMCAMEDANAYPTRSLSVEVATYFPLINLAYKAEQEELVKEAKIQSTYIAISCGILVLVLLLFLYLGWRIKKNTFLEKKNAELKQALEKASIADQIKTEFIQNMRHEIRTPLNSIIGFSLLMSNEMPEHEREEYKDIIQNNADHLLSIVDDIIDASSMEVGAFNFEYKECELDHICNESIKRFASLKHEGVRIIYDYNDTGLTINTDATRVKQVISHMLGNACKNTTEGVIVLSVSHQESDDTFKFIVTDTGTGVPSDKAEIIFHHFQKLDRYSPGIGLGLYVSRLIARALGGDIYLDTTYTEGARFVFTIPNHKEQHQEERE